MIKFLYKSILYIILIIIFLTNSVFAKINSKILFSINNSIITNIDLENEKKFLLFLNPSLNNLDETKITNISLDSLKNRKIKELELSKFFNMGDPNLGSIFVDNYISNSGFNDKQKIIEELNKFDLEYNYFTNNLKIDNLWRKFIYDKFRPQIIINEDELKRKIRDSGNEIEELNLSEILFRNNSSENFNNYKKQIYSEIENSGFEVAATIYSISETKNFGGKLGWVSSGQISEIIYSKIKSDTKITEPIETANGFLILKINDRRKISKEINFDEELDILVKKEINDELNKLGYIYFNKIKKKTFISEK